MADSDAIRQGPELISQAMHASAGTHQNNVLVVLTIVPISPCNLTCGESFDYR